MINVFELLAAQDSGRLNSKQKSEIKAEYNRIYPQRKLNSGCKDCLRDALIEINFAYNSANDYIIKRGYVVKHEGRTYHTNQLTNSQVLKFIAENPHEKYKFEKIG